MTALSITAAAAEAPDAPAVVTATRTWTFAELAARGHREPGRAIVATPSIDTIAAVLAALDAGRPVALLHPRAAAGAHDAARAALAASPPPPDTAVVLFTSGSTGAPRGVILSRRAIAAAVDASAAHLGWRDDDRWLLCLPLAHAGGLSVVLRCLAARRPVVLHDAPFEPAAVAALATTARATLASLVPTQLDTSLRARDRRDAPRQRVAGPSARGLGGAPLRAVLLGGAAASPALLERAAAAGVPALRTYGLTETFGQVATQALADAGRPDAPIVALPGVTLTAGAPGAPAPIGITTPSMMTGYLGEPPRPAGTPLVTSDLGWLDARGGLHVVGRADDVIVTGGENVHPAEVEAALARAPGVAAACAVGVPDARWGEVVAAAIVAAPDHDDAALRAWIAARLPPHHRPRRLVVVAALPLGPTGKVDRRAVRALLGA